MFTLILTLIVSQPACSGPNCLGYSTIASVPGFESLGLCEQAGQRPRSSTTRSPPRLGYGGAPAV